jgi:hypothetical protein
MVGGQLGKAFGMSEMAVRSAGMRRPRSQGERITT